jgi:hypothetical protein
MNDELVDDKFSEFNLAYELTSTYLLESEYKTRTLRDGITRRLLSIRLRGSAPDEYAHFCERAENICRLRLQQTNINQPEIWAIESFFQALQPLARTRDNGEFVHDIDDPNKRSVFREKFFSKNVPAILTGLLKDRKTLPVSYGLRHAFEQELANDWELKFTVNYYLRSDQFDDEPFNQLIALVSQFFNRN